MKEIAGEIKRSRGSNREERGNGRLYIGKTSRQRKARRDANRIGERNEEGTEQKEGCTSDRKYKRTRGWEKKRGKPKKGKFKRLG